MARGARYRVPFRRSREKKTDYRRRLRLLFSQKPRAVARISNACAIAQVVEFDQAGDRVLASASSKQLEKLGWKGSGKGLPACYLVGYLLAKRAREKDIEEAVLDLGSKSPIHGSRAFALLKGMVDGGLKLPHSDSALPGDERIRGEHIANYASSLSKKEKEERFSSYISKGLDPEELPKHFDEVLEKIRGA